MSGIDSGGSKLYSYFREDYADWKNEGFPICLEYGEYCYFLSWLQKYHPEDYGKVEIEILDRKDFEPIRYQ